MDPSQKQQTESFPTENQEENENQTDKYAGVEPIYVMTLELEQGKAEQIKIYSDSEPSELAYAFCKEHDLDYNAHEYLSEKIEVLLNQYKDNAEDNSQIEEVEDEHGLTESNNNSNNNLNDVNKKGKFVYSTNDVEEDIDNNNLVHNNNGNININNGNINNNNNIKVNQDENSLRYSENSSMRNQNLKRDNKNNVIENNKKNNEDDEVVISENTESGGKIRENENKDNLIHINDENKNEKYEKELQESLEDDPKEQNKNVQEEFIATTSNNLVSENSNYNNSSPNNNENIHVEINNFLSKNKKEIDKKQGVNFNIENNVSSNNKNKLNSASNTKHKSKPIKVKKNDNINENIKTKEKKNINNNSQPKLNEFVPLSNKRPIHENQKSNNLNQNMTNNSSFSVQMNILNKCPSNYSKISGGSIFDRLFMDSEMRRLVPKKPCHFGYRNEKENNLNNENNSVNNKLYKTQPTSENKRKEKKIIQDENGNNINYGEYMYNRDKNFRKNHLDQMEEIKKQIEDEEVESCSFKPKVNTEYNNKLSENQTSMAQSYKRQLSKSKLERLEKEYNQKYPFKPSINDNYKTDLSFKERQQFFSNLYKQRHQELCNLLNNNKEDENGKPMFRPTLVSKQLNTFNKGNNNNYNLDVYTRNYTIAKQEEDKRDTLYNKYYRNKKENAIPIENSKRKNKRIMDKIHKSVFDTIFRELDSDQDGLISPIHINTERLPNQIATIIEPLINELKDDNQTLSNEDFIHAMNSLYNDLTIVDKHTLINTYRNTRKQTAGASKNKNEENKGNNNTSKLEQNKKNRNKNNSFSVFDSKRKIDINTERLANNHDKRMEQMFDNYMKTYNNKDYNQIFFDNNNIHTIQNPNLNKSEYFNNQKNNNNNTSVRDNNSEFSSICNFTFDNYIRNLN